MGWDEIRCENRIGKNKMREKQGIREARIGKTMT